MPNAPDHCTTPRPWPHATMFSQVFNVLRGGFIPAYAANVRSQHLVYNTQQSRARCKSAAVVTITASSALNHPYPTNKLLTASATSSAAREYHLHLLRFAGSLYPKCCFSCRYPNGTTAERKVIRDAHIQYTLGLLWFWAHDNATGEGLHEELRQVGHCNDE